VDSPKGKGESGLPVKLMDNVKSIEYATLFDIRKHFYYNKHTDGRYGGIKMSKKQPKEARIEAIIDAAVEEFLEKGYNGASVDAIAKRAGISKGGFYHHFPNKEVLLMEAKRKLSEPIMALAQKAYTNESASDGLRIYISEYLKYWIERPRELSFFFLCMSKSLESEILMRYYREYMKESTDFFTYMFKKIEEEGHENFSDPEIMGITLMGALDGVMVYLITNPEENIDNITKRLEKVWLMHN